MKLKVNMDAFNKKFVPIKNPNYTNATVSPAKNKISDSIYIISNVSIKNPRLRFINAKVRFKS